MSEVTEQDVRRVAELANLQLTAEETPRMQRDLNNILTYVAQLTSIDTTGVEPMAQVNDLLGDLLPALAPLTHGETLRPDATAPSVDRRAVMAAAPETDGRFFKVPKVIER